MAIDSPEVHTTPPAKLRSAPEVPTVPCAIAFVPVVVELGNNRQYPAVPDVTVLVVVTALNVKTPEVTVPSVEEHGIETSSVPLNAVAQLDG